MEQDFTQVLQSLLDTDEGKKGLQQVMNMLGGGEADAEKDLPRGIDAPSSSPQEEASFGLDSLGINMQTILGLQKMMSGLKAHDKNTDFILALKPLLRPERQARADQAVKLMKLISLFPMLRESGILNDLNLF